MFQQVSQARTAPVTDADWPSSSFESTFYFLRHGEIWLDGTGEFSKWRSTFHEYPEELLRARLAEECFRVWHYGEYNFVQRVARRRDSIAISICIGEFVTGAMRTVLLMSRDFTPYWKWLPFEFRKRMRDQLYAGLREELVSIHSIERQVEIVQCICGLVHQHLLEAAGLQAKAGIPTSCRCSTTKSSWRKFDPC